MEEFREWGMMAGAVAVGTVLAAITVQKINEAAAERQMLRDAAAKMKP